MLIKKHYVIMKESTNTPVNNTHLSEEELQYFKQLLDREYDQSKQKLQELKQNYEDLIGNNEDTKSSRDHHQGDIATDESSKLTLMTAIDRENEKIEQINIALSKIESGNYGTCIETNQPIQKERLKTIPYALRSVGAKK